MNSTGELGSPQAMAFEPASMYAPPEADTLTGMRWTIEDAEQKIARAEAAIERGEMQVAIDLLHSAGEDLSNADWAE